MSAFSLLRPSAKALRAAESAGSRLPVRAASSAAAVEETASAEEVASVDDVSSPEDGMS